MAEKETIVIVDAVATPAATRTPLLKRPCTWGVIAAFVTTLVFVSIGLSTLHPNIKFSLTSGDAYFGEDSALLAMTVHVTGLPSVHDIELRSATCQVFANQQPTRLASVHIPRTFLPSGVVRSTKAIDTHVPVNVTINEVEYDMVRNLMDNEGMSSLEVRCRARTVLWAWGFIPAHKTLKTSYKLDTPTTRHSRQGSSSPFSFSMAFTDVQMTSLVLEISKRVSVQLPETLRWFNLHVPAIEYQISQTQYADKAAWRLHSRPFVWNAVSRAPVSLTLEASCTRADKAQCWLASPPMGVMSSLARDEEATLSVEATSSSFATRLLGTHSINMMLIGSEAQTDAQIAKSGAQMTSGNCFVVQWDFEVVGFACHELGNSMFAMTMNGRDPEEDAFGAFIRADWDEANTIALVEAGTHIRNFGSVGMNATLRIPERSISALMVGFDDSYGDHEEKMRGAMHGYWMQDGDENNPKGGIRAFTESKVEAMGIDPLHVMAKIGLDWDDMEIGARLRWDNETTPFFVGEVAVGLEDTAEGTAILVDRFDLNINDHRLLNMSGRLDTTHSGVEVSVIEFGDAGEQVLMLHTGLTGSDANGLELAMFLEMIEEEHEVNADAELSYDKALDSLHFHFQGEKNSDSVHLAADLTWDNMCPPDDDECFIGDLLDMRLLGTLEVTSNETHAVQMHGVFAVDSVHGALASATFSDQFEANMHARLQWWSMYDEMHNGLDTLRGSVHFSNGNNTEFDGSLSLGSDWYTQIDATIMEEASETLLSAGLDWNEGRFAPYVRVILNAEVFLNTTLTLFSNDEGTGFSLEDGGETEFDRMFLGAKWIDPDEHDIDLHMHAALINEDYRWVEVSFDLAADAGSEAMIQTDVLFVFHDREILHGNFSLELLDSVEMFNVSLGGGVSFDDARRLWLLEGSIAGDKATEQAMGSVSVFNAASDEFDVHVEGSGAWADADGLSIMANTDLTFFGFDGAGVLRFSVDQNDTMMLSVGAMNAEVDMQILAQGTLATTRNQLHAQGHAQVQDHGDKQVEWLFDVLLTDDITITVSAADVDDDTQFVSIAAVIDGSQPQIKLSGALAANVKNVTDLGSSSVMLALDTDANLLTLGASMTDADHVHTALKVAIGAQKSEESVLLTVEPEYVHHDQHGGADDNMSGMFSLQVDSRMREMTLSVGSMDHEESQMTGEVHFDWMDHDDELTFNIHVHSTDRTDLLYAANTTLTVASHSLTAHGSMASTDSEAMAHGILNWDATNGLALKGTAQGQVDADMFDVDSQLIYDERDNSLLVSVHDRDSEMHFVHIERADRSNGLLFSTHTFAGSHAENETDVSAFVGFNLAESELFVGFNDYLDSLSLSDAEHIIRGDLPSDLPEDIPVVKTMVDPQSMGTHARAGVSLQTNYDQGFALGANLLVTMDGELQISSTDKLDINGDQKMISVEADLVTTDSTLMSTMFMMDWKSMSMWETLGSMHGNFVLNSDQLFVLDGSLTQGETPSASPPPSSTSSPSSVPTQSVSPSGTVTPTRSPTPSKTISLTRSVSKTISTSPSPSASSGQTQTASPSPSPSALPQVVASTTLQGVTADQFTEAVQDAFVDGVVQSLGDESITADDITITDFHDAPSKQGALVVNFVITVTQLNTAEAVLNVVTNTASSNSTQLPSFIAAITEALAAQGITVTGVTVEAEVAVPPPPTPTPTPTRTPIPTLEGSASTPSLGMCLVLSLVVSLLSSKWIG